jgi:hypothetical protein
MVGVLLALSTVVTWMMFDAEPQRVAWSDYIQPKQIVSLLILSCIICGLTFWTVRLWCEQSPAREQSLDAAWNAGMRAVGLRGLRLDAIPIFLMLGCRDVQSQKNLLLQAGMRLSIEPIPADPNSPIKWYIAENYIVIGCNDIGIYSATQERLALHQESDRMLAMETQSDVQLVRILSEDSQRPARMGTQNEALGSTHTYSSVHRIKSRSKVGGSALKNAFNNETSVAVQSARSLDSSIESVHSESAEGNSLDTSVGSRGNSTDTTEAFANIDQADQLLQTLHDLPERELDTSTSRIELHQSARQLLSSSEILRYQELLEDLCRRLRSARMGTAPINGAMVWVDTPQLLTCAMYTKQCAFSLRRDLDQLRDELGLVAPVTLVMDKMQGLDGFKELIRRLGPERSQNMQLGEDCDLQLNPEADQLEHLGERAVQSIARVIYHSFRVPFAQNATSNQALSKLLFTCRGSLRLALRTLLTESFAMDRIDGREVTAPMVSGVLFTAAGDSPVEQGFASRLVQRFCRQEGLLNWTSARLKLERRLIVANWILGVCCCALGIMFLTQLFLYLF